MQKAASSAVALWLKIDYVYFSRGEKPFDVRKARISASRDNNVKVSRGQFFGPSGLVDPATQQQSSLSGSSELQANRSTQKMHHGRCFLDQGSDFSYRRFIE